MREGISIPDLQSAQIYKKVTSGHKPACLEKVKDLESLDLINQCLTEETSRLTVQECLDHHILAVDPEVPVISVHGENKNQLTLQVDFKGNDIGNFRS